MTHPQDKAQQSQDPQQQPSKPPQSKAAPKDPPAIPIKDSHTVEFSEYPGNNESD